MDSRIQKQKGCFVGGIQRFSTEDGPGIRTTVFLKGCPLKCAWCHNPELISPQFAVLYKKKKCIGCGSCINACPKKAVLMGEEGILTDMERCDNCLICVEECPAEALYTKSRTLSVDEIFEEIEKDRNFYERSGGGVTLSGGEILSHASFAVAIAQKCRAAGISVAADTSGYGRYEDLYRLAELSDHILYDLKQMDKEKHIHFTAVSPEKIWDNLIQLSEDEKIREKIIIRVPFIHGVNDDEENVQTLCKFMLKHQLKTVNFLPYHSMGISKAREVGIIQDKFETPSDETLEAVRVLFQEKGINVTIMGHEE